MSGIAKGISLVALVMLAFPGCGDSDNDSAPDSVTSEVESDLLQLREEEKLARDVYLTLFDQWNVDLFNNIAGSEQRHMDEVLVHLDALGIADPVVDDTIGVFTNTELGDLYIQLTDQGLVSEVAALTVATTIEDLDIYDIQQMMGHTDDASILDTYAKLSCGSTNHMRGFTAALVDAGGSYTAQFISADDYAAILAAEHQMCGQH